MTTTGGIGEACNAGGEAHEGILVTVTDVTIETEPNNYGEITINDGSGATQLEDSILDTVTHLSDALGSPLIGKTIESVTGVVRFAFGSFEIHPRDASDIVFLTCSDGGDASSATHTAYQINTDVTGSGDCEASNLVGTFVTVAGYVTGLDTNGFYMQDGMVAAAHTGIYVYLGTDALKTAYLSDRTVGEQVSQGCL